MPLPICTALLRFLLLLQPFCESSTTRVRGFAHHYLSSATACYLVLLVFVSTQIYNERSMHDIFFLLRFPSFFFASDCVSSSVKKSSFPLVSKGRNSPAPFFNLHYTIQSFSVLAVSHQLTVSDSDRLSHMICLPLHLSSRPITIAFLAPQS